MLAGMIFLRSEIRYLCFGVLLWLQITAFCVYGQSLTSVGLENGLSNNTVTAIFKDRFGFMWFGTEDGLNKFDGYTLKVFRTGNKKSGTLPDNRITAICDDHNGNLWIGTYAGPCKLDISTGKITAVNFKGRINDIIRDREGNIVMSTADHGVLIVNSATGSIRPVPLGLGEKKTFRYSAAPLHVDAQGSIWLYSDNVGIARIVPSENLARKVGGKVTSVNSLTTDNYGNLWIGANSGLFCIRKGTAIIKPVPEITRYASSRVMHACFDDQQNLWISTDGDGIVVYNPAANKVLRTLTEGEFSQLSSNFVCTVYIDKEGRKWVGTSRGGVSIIDNKKLQFQAFRNIPFNTNSIAAGSPTSFCEDGSTVWIGTDGNGISIWHRKTGNFSHLRHNSLKANSLPHNRVLSLTKDTEGKFYVASYGCGVVSYDKRTGVFKNIPFSKENQDATYSFALITDSHNDVYAGCYKGRWAMEQTSFLFKLDRRTEKFGTVRNPVKEEIFAMEEDNKSNLWLGTLYGVIRYNTVTGESRSFNLGAHVRALCFANGRIWIGTMGKGLFMLSEKDNVIRKFSESEGLANNFVVGIEADRKGAIWLATYHGISRLDLKNARFHNYDVADGLQSRQFYQNSSGRLSTGELLFGGIRGFNVFNPDSVRTYMGFPELVITGSRSVNKSSASTSIVLPFNQSMLSLDYSALEYSFPQKIEYAYYLEDWDKSWNYVKSIRSLNYSKINPGKYKLFINSTNASGVWNPHPISINIIVLPPWYRTWWAAVIFLLIAILLVWLYVRYQKNRQRLHYEVEMANLKIRQETELNERKMAFFTNVAHEFRAPLTLILDPVKEWMALKGNHLNLPDINVVYRNAKRLLSLVDQLLLFKSADSEVSDLNLAKVNLNELCNDVFLCFSGMARYRSLDYSYSADEQCIEIYADRDKIEIILFNLISNAIKFSPSGGTVRLTLSFRGEEAEICVQDSGPGIPAETGDKLFSKFYRVPQSRAVKTESGFGVGLFVSRLLAEKHGGTLTYLNPGKGTIFQLRLPLSLHADHPGTSSVSSFDTRENSFLSELVVDSDAGAASKNYADSAVGFIESITGEKPVVLVVDDDAEMRNFIRSILNADYTIREAESAEDALKSVSNHEPDIIVSDVLMKEMSGLELCIAIKDNPETCQIPVILLTASVSEESRIKGIEGGADDYLCKPFDRKLLLARIRSVLRSRSSLRQFFLNEITLKRNTLQVSEEYRDFLTKCISVAESHLTDESFNAKVFSEEMGMSYSNLFRKIKAISGFSVTEFIRMVRLRRAAQMMAETDLQIKEVAFLVGFKDLRYFREQFFKLFSVNPSAYIKKYRNIYAPGKSPKPAR